MVNSVVPDSLQSRANTMRIRADEPPLNDLRGRIWWSSPTQLFTPILLIERRAQEPSNEWPPPDDATPHSRCYKASKAVQHSETVLRRWEYVTNDWALADFRARAQWLVGMASRGKAKKDMCTEAMFSEKIAPVRKQTEWI